ncbi:DUF742 domain-containing protein [Streptomyces sp. NPDC051976]|uniref:DUF742 domain-containing protein n=1 Tax=Streptomyces sp. NPDC051976 TaxID=3154947 RepID=UPI00342AA9A5
MVRSYTATGGVATPTRSSVDEATLLKADPKVAWVGLPAQAHRVMELCLGGVLAVADVAACLELPAAVVKVLVCRLVDSGHLIARNPFVPTAATHDRELLQRILNGLHKL